MVDAGAGAGAAGGLRMASPAGRWVLAATVLGSGMASLDATVVNVALPRIGRGLHTGFASLQWVVNGYTLTLASLILIGGALGDRLGRRRVFVIGVVWFALASLLCGVAPGAGALVAARLLQGVGGALLTPGSLAILQASFHVDDRARAVGAWSGLAGITTAVGPFVGGWLIGASWRLIFLVNLPLAALVVAVALRHVPETRSPADGAGIDVTGALLGALGLAGTTFGLIERAPLPGAIGAVALVAFVVAERRVAHPMVPMTLFRSRQLSGATAVTFLVYGGFGAALFLVGIVLQVALGYSPLEAGVSLLPITAVMLVFSARAGALAQRIGPRVPMTVGPLVIATSLLLMARIAPGGHYVTTVLPAVLVLAAGLALTVAPLTATALAAADARHSGIASGINNAVARVGSLLAVAAVPLVAGIATGASAAPRALVPGFHRVVMVAAAVVALGGVVAALTIRGDVLHAATPDDATPIDEREPCFHCGADAPPLAVHAHADG